jgi:hypothetical protein
MEKILWSGNTANSSAVNVESIFCFGVEMERYWTEERRLAGLFRARVFSYLWSI